MSELRVAIFVTLAAHLTAATAARAEPVTAQRHQLAVAANTEGLRFYRANQLPRAAMRFRDATLLEPDYVLAHYNLACMASRLRDVATVVAELGWLRAAADPLAAAKLDKAKSDPDLDFASSLPAVRTVLALPPIDPRAPIDW